MATAMPLPAQSLREKIVSALEDSRYQWRTVRGLSKELHVDQEIIEEAFQGLKGTLVRSSVPDERGRTLYSTRKHYMATHSWGQRLLAAVAGRIV